MTQNLARRCWSEWDGPKARWVQRRISTLSGIYHILALNLYAIKHSFLVKGLGRSEQGSTDHVKVKLKNDNYGLGANTSYEVGTFTTW